MSRRELSKATLRTSGKVLVEHLTGQIVPDYAKAKFGTNGTAIDVYYEKLSNIFSWSHLSVEEMREILKQTNNRYTREVLQALDRFKS